MGAPEIDMDRLARVLAPAVAREILVDRERTLAAARAQWLVEKEGERRRQNELMDACVMVGKAVDRLLQVKFTAAEPGARIALETAAKRLKAAMAKGPTHG